MVFAVTIETGEIGYCSILGAGDEVYGLAVYRGEAGLQTLTKVIVEDMMDETIFHEQDSFLLSFEDRADLLNEDYALIQSAGVKFRGKKAWPSFRSKRPSYAPWKLNQDEVNVMIKIMEQAIIVATRFREQPDLFLSGAHDQFFARIATLQDGVVVWKDGWTSSLPTLVEMSEQPLHISEFQIAKLKKDFPLSKTMWEQGTFYLPMPIQEDLNEPPYYPQLSLSIDCHSELIVAQQLITLEDDLNEVIQYQVMDNIMTLKARPESIYVDNKLVYWALMALCEQLDIGLYAVERLPLLAHINEDMARSMGGE